MAVDVLKGIIQVLVNEDRQLGSSGSDDTPKLPPWAVEALIDKYGDNPGGGAPDVRWGYVKMSEFERVRKKVGEFSKTAAVYSDRANFMLVNVEVAGGNAEMIVNSILHELRHYNQAQRWKWDDKFKFNFAKGKKLPPGKDEYDLYEIEWEEITQFWLKSYGYKNSPHEVDARQFASQNLQSAMKFLASQIDQHEV